MPSLISLLVPTIGAVIALVKYGYGPVMLRAEVLGFTRPQGQGTANIHFSEPDLIPNSLFCEDIHLHQASGTLFGISQTDPTSRSRFFPPTTNFNTTGLDQAKIFVLDPYTNKAQLMQYDNFEMSFIGHGFDIYTPPGAPELVYIFAINHLPNPAYLTALSAADAELGKVDKARSRVEIFAHKLGSNSVKHIRSVFHPLIRTPNDVLILDEHNFYITNDYYTREGLGRMIEDIGWDELAKWSDVIHVNVDDLTIRNDDTASVSASQAIPRIHNPNGIAWGKTKDEIIINRASPGVMHLAQIADPATGNYSLVISSSTQMPNAIDNPSYFRDPFAESTGRDASGYVLAGMLRGCDFPDKAEMLPSATWLVGAQYMQQQRRIIFQDNGAKIKMASTAVLVAIDPKLNSGKKEAWLFVVSPLAEAGIRVKVEL